LALPIVGDCFREVDAKYPDLDKYRRRHEALRRFFGVLVEDVIAVSRANLEQLDPPTCGDIRGAGRMMVQFSPTLWANLKIVRKFLFSQMYRAPSVVKMREDVTKVVEDLFPLFMAQPEHLPKQWRKDVADADGETALARIVSDYISGMTDRFARETHERLVG
jgi:dGTPase